MGLPRVRYDLATEPTTKHPLESIYGLVVLLSLGEGREREKKMIEEFDKDGDCF